MGSPEEKYEKLKTLVRDMGSLVVAFSGGVDSTFLLKVCSDILGDKVLAVTATSPTYPGHEFEEAKKLASFIGCRYEVIESNELEISGFSENSPRRCYFCKSELFGLLKEKAGDLGYTHVADGANCDDLGDYRPGRDAAKELGVRSPLVEAGMTKEDIRLLSRELGLATWNKPSFACLSSRFPYGTGITYDRVKRVEKCEDILRSLSFRQFRVRFHDDVARIETTVEDFEKFLSPPVRDAIIKGFKENGFSYISLDIEGYRTGSMNEAIA
ncbi:MAG: ATP-dependent sacrificial sulfur transferase LarE [Deltaproteobacteria bacterium]|nr:ATP-dependent sacrificial sulfur transferase LarE [Deltaproteobacteria bacterium]